MNQSINGEAKLITTILYKGGGEKVLKALLERGILMTGHIHARGSAIGDHLEKTGLPRTFEQEIITCVVEASKADELFQFIFEVAEIDRPHGGFMYMEKLGRAHSWQIPQVG